MMRRGFWAGLIATAIWVLPGGLLGGSQSRPPGQSQQGTQASEANESNRCIKCHAAQVAGFARSKMSHSMQ
jgi:hypothetical protein